MMKADSQRHVLAFWCLVYSLALPAGWAARVMLVEPLGNLAWVGVVFFLAWLPLRLVPPRPTYISLLGSSFGPLSGFEALFIGLEANLGMIALLMALLPLLVAAILLVSVAVFLIPAGIVMIVRLVRGTSAERRADLHQIQDWFSTNGVGLVKGYGIYLAGLAIGMGLGLLSRALFGVALDATALSTSGLLAQSLLIRFFVGAVLGLVVYASLRLKKMSR